jgi:hypothetical protein
LPTEIGSDAEWDIEWNAATPFFTTTPPTPEVRNIATIGTLNVTENFSPTSTTFLTNSHIATALGVPTVNEDSSLSAAGRIMVHGAYTNGMTILGTSNNQARDRVVVEVERYSTVERCEASRYVYSVPFVSLSEVREVSIEPSHQWNIDLDLEYGVDETGFHTLSGVVIDPTFISEPNAVREVQICSPNEGGCFMAQSLTKLDYSSATFTFTFTSSNPPLPDYGIVHVISGNRELIRPYQAIKGAGPAHYDGDAPLADGRVMATGENAFKENLRAIFISPTANINALCIPKTDAMPSPQLVAPPLDIDFVCQNGFCDSADEVTLSFFYEPSVPIGNPQLLVNSLVFDSFDSVQIDAIPIHDPSLHRLTYEVRLINGTYIIVDP